MRALSKSSAMCEQFIAFYQVIEFYFRFESCETNKNMNKSVRDGL